MAMKTGRVDNGGNDVQKQGPNDIIMDQKKAYPLTAGATTAIPAEAIMAGIIDRSGPGAGYADTWPTADAILAASPNLDTGDAFEFLFINGVAFANATAVIANTGVTLLNGSVTASLIKRFMLTVLAAGRTAILSATTTNGNAVVNLASLGVSPSRAATLAQQIRVGMLVTGTGIPASTTVIAVNSVTGTVTLSANATASGDTALTFQPRVEIRGLYQAAA